jgi:hypothetical protein
MALEDTHYWSMSHNADTRSIELDWKDATSAMSGDDFKEALQHFAGHIREEGATGALVDVRRFRFATTADLEPWRLQNIVPRRRPGLAEAGRLGVPAELTECKYVGANAWIQKLDLEPAIRDGAGLAGELI